MDNAYTTRPPEDSTREQVTELKPTAYSILLWLFALPLLSPMPIRAASGPASTDLAPALAEDSNSSLRSNLIARIEFQELNLQLSGISAPGAAAGCLIKHPGAGQPMSYRVGDVIGGYRIQSIENGSVCFERYGLRFWLKPEKQPALIKAEPPSSMKARQELLAEIESARAIQGEPETIQANVQLKSRTKKYGAARIVQDASKLMSRRGTRIASASGRRGSAGMFRLPMPGLLTSQYGYRRHPMGGGEKFHHGIDIANKSGNSVVAAASGTVSRVGYNGSYGRYIIVTHGGGYETLYAHLSRQLVRAGQEVDQGQLIGREGDTGRSTGPHLHFEVHKNGHSVDPESYVTVHK